VLFLAATSGPIQAQGLPPGFPDITVTVCDDPAPGYIFLSNFAFDPDLGNVPFLLILDNTGHPVQYKRLDTPINLNFTRLPNGKLTYSDLTTYCVLDDEMNVVGTFDAGNGYHTDGHELRLLPNGHAYILAWRLRTVDMTAYGGLPNAKVQDFAIQEVDDAGNVYWQWETADHLEITDTTPDIPLTGALIDYAHCNAIEVCPDGNLLLSIRHFDEIIKIDRQTGQILWRMGGSFSKNNEFTFINDTFPQGEEPYLPDDPEGGGANTADRRKREVFFGFSHQHAVRLLENGNLLVFDNGNLRQPPFSRAVEYQINEANRTVRKVWEYRHTPDVESSEMGCAWRLDNGNTLIGWGGNDQGVTVTEVRPDGTTAFELCLPDQIFSYRAYRLVYGMISASQWIAEAGPYHFSGPEGSTGITLDVAMASGSGTVTVERHGYRPRRLRFIGSRPPGNIPERRWVIRWRKNLDLAATLRLDAAAAGDLAAPDGATIWHRAAEGLGDFEPLPTTYDPVSASWSAPLPGPGEFMIVDGPEPLVLRLELGQNAPNPFRETTRIRYRLPEETKVRLSVFSVSGRELIPLVDGVQPAGEHVVALDAGRLPAGTYFYRLRTPLGTLQHKAVLAGR
jgi:hypothetical protein